MLISTAQDKDVLGETIKTEDVALLSSHVATVRVTVMVLWMVVPMMVMMAVRGTWSVALTIA